MNCNVELVGVLAELVDSVEVEKEVVDSVGDSVVGSVVDLVGVDMEEVD